MRSNYKSVGANELTLQHGSLLILFVRIEALIICHTATNNKDNVQAK